MVGYDTANDFRAWQVSEMGGVNVYNLSVVLFIALGSFTYGFNSSIIGSVTALPAFYEYFELSSTGPRAGYTTDMVGGTFTARPTSYER